MTDVEQFEKFRREYNDLLIPEDEIFTTAKKPLVQVFALTLPEGILYVSPKKVIRLTVSAPEILKSRLYMLVAQRRYLKDKGVIWEHFKAQESEWNSDIYITLYSWIKSRQLG